MNIQSIELETTRKELTHLSGLLFFTDLINRLNLVNRLGEILPRMIRNSGKLPKNKFFIGVLAFIAGADCIDDLGDLRNEHLFRKMTDGGVAPTTMRTFLGIFKLKHFERLQNFLPKISYELREKIFPKSKRIIITMDATPHEQYGKKMEQVDWCYNNVWGYTSQNAFDEKGFCYGWNLMNGSSHSHKGAVEMIERIFQNIPRNKKRYFRADSAYGSHKVYNALKGLGVNFTICLKSNVWGSLLEKKGNSIEWKRTKIKFFESNKCQIGSIDSYRPKDLKGKDSLRVVYIRCKKKVLTEEDKYTFNYYAIITDMSAGQMSDEEVIQFYRGRANAENFIKDLKYGMDFKHFPCKKLNANKVYGLIGTMAYNMMRMASFLIDEKRGCLSKKIRKLLLEIPSQVVSHARRLTIKINWKRKEVFDCCYNKFKKLVARFYEKST